MNPDEQTAEVYLNSLKLGAPIYEPDGNIPPDFSLPGGIAIEVRRLNTHSFDSGKAVGLEQAEYPLLSAVRGVMDEFTGNHAGKSFFIFVRFDRPIPNKRQLQNALRSKLGAFLSGSRSSQKHLRVVGNIEIDIIPASKDRGTPFVMGGDSDEQRGGWLLEDMEENIQHSSDDKQRKVAPYRNRYSQWWLILIDHIGYALDELDREQFKRDVSINHIWDKIVLVDPRNGNRAYEI